MKTGSGKSFRSAAVVCLALLMLFAPAVRLYAADFEAVAFRQGGTSDEPEEFGQDEPTYLTEEQELYCSLEGVDLYGPSVSFSAKHEDDSNAVYAGKGDYWGYGDCFYTVDNSDLPIPGIDDPEAEEDISFWVYLDSPEIVNHRGEASLYTEDTMFSMADKLEIREVGTFDNCGVSFYYGSSVSDTCAEYYAGTKLFNGVYIYLEFDFYTDQPIDDDVMASFDRQFEAFVDRLELYSHDVPAEETAIPKHTETEGVILTLKDGCLVGSRPVLTENTDVLELYSYKPGDDWDVELEFTVGGQPFELWYELYEADDEYSGLTEAELSLLLAEDVLSAANSEDIDACVITPDPETVEAKGVRWVTEALVYENARNSEGDTNGWLLEGFGITDSGEVIEIYLELYPSDPDPDDETGFDAVPFLSDEAYQEVCSGVFERFNDWLGTLEYTEKTDTKAESPQTVYLSLDGADLCGAAIDLGADSGISSFEFYSDLDYCAWVGDVGCSVSYTMSSGPDGDDLTDVAYSIRLDSAETENPDGGTVSYVSGELYNFFEDNGVSPDNVQYWPKDDTVWIYGAEEDRYSVYYYACAEISVDMYVYLSAVFSPCDMENADLESFEEMFLDFTGQLEIREHGEVSAPDAAPVLFIDPETGCRYNGTFGKPYGTVYTDAWTESLGWSCVDVIERKDCRFNGTVSLWTDPDLQWMSRDDAEEHLIYLLEEETEWYDADGIGSRSDLIEFETHGIRWIYGYYSVPVLMDSEGQTNGFIAEAMGFTEDGAVIRAMLDIDPWIYRLSDEENQALYATLPDEEYRGINADLLDNWIALISSIHNADLCSEGEDDTEASEEDDASSAAVPEAAEPAVPALPSAAAVEDAYNQYIATCSWAADMFPELAIDKVAYGSGEYYFYDIDRDGIEEMIVSYGLARMDWHYGIYSLRGGAVVLLGTGFSPRGPVYGRASAGGIMMMDVNMGEEWPVYTGICQDQLSGYIDYMTGDGPQHTDGPDAFPPSYWQSDDWVILTPVGIVVI